MDYSVFTKTILAKVLAAMNVINNPEVAPAVRQRNQEILFQTVGARVYAKIYDMNAFDFQIEQTVGTGIDDRFYGLAKVASAAVATGALGLDAYVKNYIDSTISMAQKDAVNTAREYGKRTRVVRKLGRTEKTCEWCIGLANGSPYEGSAIRAEIFGRHRDCDCEIYTEGFRTRNGLLDNYVKPSDR